MDRELRIRHRFRLRDFETLLAVAREGSMAKASVQLSVSQPAVSKAISEMEHALGLRLLDRTARGVEPTLYGRVLLKCAGAVIDDVRQSVKELEFLADPTSGELRIGSTEPIVAGMLPVVLDRLGRRYPRIAFHVMESSTVASQYRELREREVDLLIGRFLSATAEEDFDTEILFDDPLFVVAGAKSRWARRKSIALRELANEPWTLPRPNTIVRTLLEDAFRAQGVDPPRTGVICNSIQLHTALLATGRYLAIFPRSMLRLSDRRSGLKVLPVDLPAQPWPVVILTLKNRTISPIAQLFLACARDVAKLLIN